MSALESKLSTVRLAVVFGLLLVGVAACAPPAASPTPAAAKPPPTSAPGPAAPTPAPAKPAPTAAKAAEPAEFDQKAVADFYRGKTVRIIVGFAPGGATDTFVRMLQPVLSRYIPGNPTVVVENKPGGGSMLAANTLYNTEPKDGTAMAAFDAPIILQQVIGAPGVQFDAAKMEWLTSAFESASMCAVRLDAGIGSVQEIMGPAGKEVTVSSFGKGGSSYNPPAAFNAALGTRFKIITGYEGGAAQRLAVKNKEVQGFCTTFETVKGIERGMMEGPGACCKVLIVGGSKPLDHPFARGVPAAGELASSDEARALLKVIDAPDLITLPVAAPPGVPRERVQALRRAFDQAHADPEYRAAAAKVQQSVSPYPGEQIAQVVQEMLNAPPAIRARLKEILS